MEQKEDVAPPAALDDAEVVADVDAIRERIMDMLPIAVYSAVPVVLLSLARIPQLGLQPSMIGHIVGLLIGFIILYYRRRIPLAVRGWLFITLFLLVAVLTPLQFGMLAAAPFFGIAAVAISALMFSLRAAAMVLLLLTAGLSVTGVLMSSHLLQPIVAAEIYMTTPLNWVTYIAVICCVGVVLVFAFNRYAFALHEALAQLRGSERRMRDLNGELEQRLALIAQHSRNLIALIDQSGYICWVNPGFTVMTGYRSDEVIGRSFPVLLLPAHRQRTLIQAIDRTLQCNQSSLNELPIVNQQGQQRWLHLSLERLPSTDGEPPQCVLIAQDISEQKRSEQALIEAREAAEASNRAKSMFLAAMSHELRTPINGMMGMVELLGHTDPTARQQQMLNTINGAAGSLLQLINDILDLSQLEADRLKLRPKSTDIPYLVTDVVRLLQAQAEQQQLQLSCSCDPALTMPLQVDPLRLRQILINLVANGLKFSASDATRPGWVRLTVQLLWRDTDNLGIEFRVEDNGIGIESSFLPRLFEPFEQSEQRADRRFEGAGLGLSICYRLVKQMGGEIDVSSEVGVGTTFRVTLLLPLAGGDAASSAVDNEQRSALTARATMPPNAPILVVEDNPLNRMVMSEQFQQLGLDAEIVEGGEQALVRLQQHTYMLVITDYFMPRMDGLALIQHLRHQPATAQLPIVVISANISASEMAQLRAAGADEVLLKPLGLARLREIVAQYRRS